MRLAVAESVFLGFRFEHRGSDAGYWKPTSEKPDYLSLDALQKLTTLLSRYHEHKSLREFKASGQGPRLVKKIAAIYRAVGGRLSEKQQAQRIRAVFRTEGFELDGTTLQKLIATQKMILAERGAVMCAQKTVGRVFALSQTTLRNLKVRTRDLFPSGAFDGGASAAALLTYVGRIFGWSTSEIQALNALANWRHARRDREIDMSKNIDLMQREILERIVAQAERGLVELPKKIRLPAKKDDSPKILCLDLNQWIYLARASLGKDARAANALARLRTAVEKHGLIVPILSTNTIEVSENSDESKRESLATFMVDLSGNRSMLAHPFVEEYELRNALATQFLKKDSGVVAIRRGLVRNGVYAATTGKEPKIDTGDARFDSIFLAAMFAPEVSIASLVNAISREVVTNAKRKDVETAETVSKIRKVDEHLSTKARRILEMRNLLKGSFAKRIDEALQELASGRAPFDAWISDDKNLLSLVASIPAIDVRATLMLEHDKSRDHATHRNDGKDYSFLQLAIPYANIVVTERSWAHLAAKSGIATKYGTIVLGTLHELPAALEKIGC